MPFRATNAPAKYQRIMDKVLNEIYKETGQKFLRIYLDDIIVFSNTFDEHQKHLQIVFDKINKYRFEVNWENMHLFLRSIECLGRTLDQQGYSPSRKRN